MTFRPPWMQPPPPQRAKDPAPVSLGARALEEMKARDGDDFGSRTTLGSTGELATPRPRETPPPAPPPVTFPAPDWEQERREQAAAQKRFDAERRRQLGRVGPESLTPPIVEDQERYPR